MANVRLTTLNDANDAFIVIDSDLTAVVRDKIISRKGGVTVTLPAATLFGDKVVVKNVGSALLTVARAGSDTIGHGNGVSFDIPTMKTYAFEVDSEGHWNVANVSAVDNMVARKMGDTIIYVNLAEAVKPLVSQSAELK